MFQFWHKLIKCWVINYDCIIIAYMSRYVLLTLSIIFCFIGIKILMHKTGDHDHDFIFKIIGLIIFLPFFLLLLSALRIAN